MSASAAAHARPPVRRPAWLAWIAAARAWLFLVAADRRLRALVAAAFGARSSSTCLNIRSIAVAAVAPLLLAIGQTFVIISGGIDLSVGFTMGLLAVIVSHGVNILTPRNSARCRRCWSRSRSRWPSSLIPGLVNGLLIARLRVPPFIGTLGMYGVARGVGLSARGRHHRAGRQHRADLPGNGDLGGFPVVVLLTAVAMFVLHYLLSQTRFGQYAYAIGGNRPRPCAPASTSSERPSGSIILSAICAAISGILYAGRFSAGAAQAGEPLLLDSIAAVVIGGASLFGGSGTIIGTLIGALIIAVIQFGLVFINVEPFWQFVAVGVVIIISVLVDQAQRTGGRVDE